jgi:hypothetical protein
VQAFKHIYSSVECIAGTVRARGGRTDAMSWQPQPCGRSPR